MTMPSDQRMLASLTETLQLAPDAAAPSSRAESAFTAESWWLLAQKYGPRILWKYTEPQLNMHFTASAMVLSETDGAVCLILHHKAKLWLQPGGHLEPEDSSVAAAASREVLEETGLSGDLHPAPLLLHRHAAPCQPGTVDWHLDVQFLITTRQRDLIQSDEVNDVGWFSYPELLDMRGQGKLGEGVLQQYQAASHRLGLSTEH